MDDNSADSTADSQNISIFSTNWSLLIGTYKANKKKRKTQEYDTSTKKRKVNELSEEERKQIKLAKNHRRKERKKKEKEEKTKVSKTIVDRNDDHVGLLSPVQDIPPVSQQTPAAREAQNLIHHATQSSNVREFNSLISSVSTPCNR